MAASFPTSAKSFTSRVAGDTIQPAHVNDLQDEVTAIETTILSGNYSAAGTPTFNGTPAVNAGLKFPATQADQSDVNTLDDYEEGTFTPTITGSTSASGQVYSLQVGFYTKIGRLVHFSLQVQLSTLGTITGSVRIGGLPFTVASSGGSTQA